MNKVLVTGGAGYIGTTLVRKLLNLGFEVTILDNLMYGQAQALFSHAENPNFKFVSASVTDKNFKILEDLVKANDIIIPLACLVGAPLCNANPSQAWDINQKQIEVVCNTANGKPVLYPTTNSGYGIGGEEMCDENSPLNPLSVYGETKVAAEKNITDYGGIAFRLATVFGASPRMRLDLLVNDFTWKAKRDGVLVLFESHFRRNYIHVKDVCEAFLHGIRNYNDMTGIFNVGLSSANLTKLQLAQVIKKHIPSLVIIESEIGQDPDKRDYLVSNAKLEATGWSPAYTLDDGIKEVIKIYDIVKAGGDVTRNY